MTETFVALRLSFVPGAEGVLLKLSLSKTWQPGIEAATIEKLSPAEQCFVRQFAAALAEALAAAR